jgi:hypothetical protein
MFHCTTNRRSEPLPSVSKYRASPALVVIQSSHSTAAVGTSGLSGPVRGWLPGPLSPPPKVSRALVEAKTLLYVVP